MTRRGFFGRCDSVKLDSVPTHSGQGAQRIERIPLLLQSVFIKSNRGAEVNKPPPELLANKNYTNNWVFRRTDRAVRNGKKHYEKSKDKVLTANKKKGTTIETTVETPLTHAPVAIEVKEEEVEYSLQEYFDALLQERGYDPQLFNTLQTGYYNTPSELQIASYGPRMVEVVKSSDGPALRETLMSGLSPNPCNKYGESLLHMVCRRGDLTMLNVMVEAGAVLQVSDDFGRTPLHDACWAAKPAFEVVKVLLKRDPYMFFLKDKRGSLPLSYVQKKEWVHWREWLDENIDSFYPESKASEFFPSDLCGLSPNTLPIPETKTDLSLELIQMIANGDLSPREALLMAEMAASAEDDDTIADTVSDCDESESEYDSEVDEDGDEDSDSENESDDDDSCIEFDDDMMEVVHLAQSRRSSL